MKMTSAQAAKLLRQLNEELRAVQIREENSRSFLASVGEDPESVRPEYDYAASQQSQTEIEAKIRKVKHALNVFNSTQEIPGFDMTIDEMLIYLPQLSRRCAVLSGMRDVLPKVRENSAYSRGSSIIDYRYANYDIEQVGRDYNTFADELSRAQTALDLVNNTVELEIEL
ncbi:MAG: hypothetical protein IJM44_00300 [Ruminococcus sp.]|nr:hypothetical protein [Ruminococcus sp.]